MTYPAQDLQYQPQVKPSTFKLPFLRTKQIIRSLILLVLEITFFLTSFIIILLSLNYYNIVSLSKLYPDLFFDLPHQTFPDQQSINNQVLADANNFNNDAKHWIIEAEFRKQEENTVYINFKGQIPTLLLTKETRCSKAGKKTPAKDGFVFSTQPLPCSDLLTKERKGKKMIIEYDLNSIGKYTIIGIQFDQN
ncbi:MAG: hypothetical protein HY344_00890 [Candidatus Levybacteria bacterium]|nr:hypothetical protein [Candidatus Levybacteria bacterium]